MLIVVRQRPNAKAIDVDLEEIMTMPLTPVRAVNEEPMCFELVKVKSETQSEILWDAVPKRAA